MVGLSDLFKEVKNLPIENVIGSYIPLKKRGRYYYGICPFHADSSEGSFVVTPGKNIYKCFTCGTKAGDAIDFVARYNQILIKEACLLIARDFDLISEYEFNSLSKEKAHPKKNQEKKVRKISPCEILADEETLHTVFLTFKRICGLSEDDKNYLLSERKMSVSSLQYFFSLPKRSEVQQVIKALGTKFGGLDILEHIPGFYYDTKYSKWKFNSVDGIGIICPSENQKISGIHIRRKTVSGKASRYIWFSSYDDEEKGFSKGTGSGAPVGVFYPRHADFNKKIAITEGEFKAITFAQNGYIAICTPGTSSWERAANMALKFSKKVSCFEIAFDSDWMENPAVRNHILSLGKKICTSLETRVCIWDPRFGKGYDDAFQQYGEKPFKFFPFSTFEKANSQAEEMSEEDLRKNSRYEAKNFKGNTEKEKLIGAFLKTVFLK